MQSLHTTRYVAFEGPRLVGSGSVKDVAEAAKARVDAGSEASLLVFDAVTSQPLELDLRGSVDDVLARVGGTAVVASDVLDAATDASAGRVGPGRPRLGVVAREITLLPRHWQWLSEQPGGASVTIRRLVDEARGASGERDRRRRAQESAYRFMSAMLGNEPGYEEATRALFAGDAVRFAEWSAAWPTDLQDHARRLAALAFDSATGNEL